MRPVRVLCTVLRLLLLLSALLVCFLVACNYLQISPALIASTTVTTPSSSSARESRLDPASLLESTSGKTIDERLRMMAFKRLSHKLAGYATASASSDSSYSSSSPETRDTTATQTVSRSEPGSVHSSSAVATSHESPASREPPTPHSLRGQSRRKSDPQTSVTAEPSLPDEQHASTLRGQSPHSTVAPSPHLSSDFHWPQPHAVRNTRELLTEQWMTDLQNCLSAMTSRDVTLLTSNQQYTEVLLNWLIAGAARAAVELSQVLVIAMDQRLHSLLQERGVASVLVRPASLLSASGLRQGVFPTVMMTRLSIIRLLNHWGYNVFNYDTDAVLLRDPSHILPAEYDIIGTFGRFPTDLTKKWGITLCTAILVVRSSRTTEEFWEALSRANPSSFSDQGKINYGLEALNVQWSLPSKKLTSLSQAVQGVCGNGLRVSLLPYNVACRAGSCTHKALSAGLYLWHKGGARVGKRKREGAQEGGVWFLRPDWTVGCDKMRHREWLKCISTGHAFTF